MHKGQGYRRGFDGDEYDSQGTPRNGHFGPGRTLYTDKRYGDSDRYIYLNDDRERIWDLDEMNINHPVNQSLVGDEMDRGFYGKGPVGYSRSDERIYEDACEALYHDRHIDASNIEVLVKDKCVYLKGEVHDRETKRRAENCVERVSGVEDVQNQIRVIGAR
jgi:hypothetical protein